ncbi:uncharacterized protein LOC111613917 [Centruroides sculpturatus]|uniref:uncharacterized protein LOC111613917 n=1 Tax=Centruroides sculpturatus TaxID=218467 RepID=UPI000C6E6F2C|nr:uncharacterized protein LOC111613917 [Centruroides sculpturatus]
MPITKAYRTIRNQSLQVIAKKLPIDFAITQKERYLQLKWGKTIQCGLRTIASDGVEWSFSYSNTLLPGCSLNCNFDDVQSAELDIYTDRSKINDAVGCGFVVFTDNMEIFSQSICLNSFCAVFQAELFSILQAIKWENNYYPKTTIQLFTDSLSAFTLLKSSKLHPFAEEIRNLPRTTSCNFAITWVRAHQGVQGNERANYLAKQAAENTALPVEYNKINLRTLRRILWEDALHNWQIKWDNNREHITQICLQY